MVWGYANCEALAHCGDCNLNTNLWLCLSCGSLGCGRQNYDGTGGKGHAKKHFAKTGHAVAVKIGTDGSACKSVKFWFYFMIISCTLLWM